MGVGREVDGRWMGGGRDECVWVHYERTVSTPSYKDVPRKSKTFRHEGFPGDSST